MIFFLIVGRMSLDFYIMYKLWNKVWEEGEIFNFY